MPFTVSERLSEPLGRVKWIDLAQLLRAIAEATSRLMTFMQPLTLELSGGEAVRLDDGLDLHAKDGRAE